MFQITKQYHLSAAHSLDLEPEHPCSRVHGHNYIVEVVLEAGRLNDDGMVLDYRIVDQLVNPLIERWDHQNLNDFFTPTTSEAMAQLIYRKLKRVKQVVAVRVSETPKTWAEYRDWEKETV